MYEQSFGSISVDDTLRRIATDERAIAFAGAFQDLYRFELRARHTVGLGDLHISVFQPPFIPIVVSGSNRTRRPVVGHGSG
jgi:hypothetical protein